MIYFTRNYNNKKTAGRCLKDHESNAAVCDLDLPAQKNHASKELSVHKTILPVIPPLASGTLHCDYIETTRNRVNKQPRTFSKLTTKRLLSDISEVYELMLDDYPEIRCEKFDEIFNHKIFNANDVHEHLRDVVDVKHELQFCNNSYSRRLLGMLDNLIVSAES